MTDIEPNYTNYAECCVAMLNSTATPFLPLTAADLNVIFRSAFNPFSASAQLWRSAQFVSDGNAMLIWLQHHHTSRRSGPYNLPVNNETIRR